MDEQEFTNEVKLLNNFLSRRNQPAIQSSISKLLKNPLRHHFAFKVSASSSQILKELRITLSSIVSGYQNDSISADLINRSLTLSKSINCVIKIGTLIPVCIMCHSLCDPYSKRVPCCGYFVHTPCLEQITSPTNKYQCVKCQKINNLSIEVTCRNCQKSLMPDKTMVSACRHIICVDCVNAAQPLTPSPYCFCCPYTLKNPAWSNIEDVQCILYSLFSICPSCEYTEKANLTQPSTCKKCKKNYCVICKARGHRGVSCVEFQV